jgi:hypothetical protein
MLAVRYFIFILCVQPIAGSDRLVKRGEHMWHDWDRGTACMCLHVHDDDNVVAGARGLSFSISTKIPRRGV